MGCGTITFGSNLSHNSSTSPSNARFRFLETPLCSFRSPLACSQLFGQLAITFQQSLNAKPLPLIAHSRPIALGVQVQLTALIVALPTAKRERDQHKAHKNTARRASVSPNSWPKNG
jgi:hypothetical protein